MYNLGLYIFRRDLRVLNNNAFAHALKECKKIIPIFIFTPTQISKNLYKSDKSVQFMIESLSDLNENLHKYNGKLHCFYGDNDEIIKYIIKNYSIDAVYVNEDYTPYSKTRDNRLKILCETNNVQFKSYDDICIFKPGTITTDTGVYKKFSPFYNKCIINLKNVTKVPKTRFKGIWCENINTNEFSISLNDAYVSYTTPSIDSLIQGGRKNALEILKNIKKFINYGETRNILTQETTKLSAYLKYGCVSSKEVLFILQKNGFDNTHDLIRQLIWRDFYIHILNAYPEVLNGASFKPKYDKIMWDNNLELFNAWKKGRTGFPIVDACMRQLNTTGYMHNRGRLIVASFLIKTLFIDWRKGEKYFATKLIDYDPAANNGNWQWVAGSGVDSQPYFRIFNPWSQSKKYDPNAEYIKKWCPELKHVSPDDIHTWNKTYNIYLNSGTKYQIPIVDYNERRKYVLEKYKTNLE